MFPIPGTYVSNIYDLIKGTINCEFCELGRNRNIYLDTILTSIHITSDHGPLAFHPPQ